MLASAKCQASRASPIRGWTVVELLVVLVIITVLAGLLLPVVGYARECGRRSACLSNLRQLGMALQQYASDHDWMAPLYTSQATEDQKLWYRSAERLRSALDPYVRNDGIWFCPNDPYAGQASAEWHVDHRFTSYVVKFSASRPPPWPYPGSVATLHWYEPGGLGVLAWDANNLRSTGGQHRGRFNLLWADGRVTTELAP